MNTSLKHAIALKLCQGSSVSVCRPISRCEAEVGDLADLLDELLVGIVEVRQVPTRRL